MTGDRRRGHAYITHSLTALHICEALCRAVLTDAKRFRDKMRRDRPSSPPHSLSNRADMDQMQVFLPSVLLGRRSILKVSLLPLPILVPLLLCCLQAASGNNSYSSAPLSLSPVTERLNTQSGGPGIKRTGRKEEEVRSVPAPRHSPRRSQ